MKGNYGKILSAAISVILIVYVVYNIFNLIYDPITTQQAVKVRVDETITLSGMAIRSEVIVNASKKGIVDYLVSDGDKVAKGETIANVYSSADGADIEKRLRDTDAEIARTEAALGARGSGVDAYSIEGTIRDELASFADACREGRLRSVDTAMDGVLSGFNMRLVAQGKVDTFTARLDELKSEYSSLVSSRVGNNSSITSPDSGYFVGYTDSLENAVDYASVKELTPSQIAELCGKTPEVSNDGNIKLIDEYEWYYIAPITGEDVKRIAVGQSIPVKFSSFLSYEINFTVEKLETDDEGNSAVIFSCSNINSELACMRNEAVTLRLDTYSGIRVSADALRVVDGVQGVYIARGQKVAFRKVEPVYLADGYIISKIDRSDSEYLQLYDDIIIGGSNIYAGKVI